MGGVNAFGADRPRLPSSQRPRRLVDSLPAQRPAYLAGELLNLHPYRLASQLVSIVHLVSVVLACGHAFMQVCRRGSLCLSPRLQPLQAIDTVVFLLCLPQSTVTHLCLGSVCSTPGCPPHRNYMPPVSAYFELLCELAAAAASSPRSSSCLRFSSCVASVRAHFPPPNDV